MKIFINYITNYITYYYTSNRYRNSAPIPPGEFLNHRGQLISRVEQIEYLVQRDLQIACPVFCAEEPVHGVRYVVVGIVVPGHGEYRRYGN